ncbi:uncharacterized protein DDB_G0286299 [Cydia strobilella]|uniref:uncharacterized protein DDB_G0286299 n=1 Tax=Cydia strobilella TaxID=1100964 RepID=UPI003007CE74
MGRKNKEKRKPKEKEDGQSDQTAAEQKFSQNEDEEEMDAQAADPEPEELPHKREHGDDYSDVEDKPKRKKKKKPIVPTKNTGPKKGQHKEKRKHKKKEAGESDQTAVEQKLSQIDDEEDMDAQAAYPEPEELPHKREHGIDYSDVEDKPKRKKKKNPIVPTENTGPQKGQHKENRKHKEKEAGESDQTTQEQKLSQNDDEEEMDTQAADSELEVLLHKQEHADDDSDVEDKPKRKKKKKPVVPTENTGPKKGQKSIRQMKREKHAERQATAHAVAKDEHKNECLNYLSQWKHNRQNWKFMKAKQVWLFKNKFSTLLVPDASWPTLLEYFDSAQGNIRKLLLEDANKIIKQLDDWTESQNKESRDDEETEETKAEAAKPDDNVYKRARDLIQCLQE